jgi:hypothetical protein
MEAVDMATKMKSFLLIFALLTLTGCRASVTIDSKPSDPAPYYMVECGETGCQLVPHFGTPPEGAEQTGQTTDGYPMYEMPKEETSFPTKEQWKRVIEHNDPSNPNNTLGYTEDGIEIRGPLKTIYLEQD